MARAEHMDRLSGFHTSVKDPHYLVYKYLFADLKSAISRFATGDVLDIGCGNKPYLPLFQEKAVTYTGCDIVQSDKNLVDIICPATAIPLPDGCKDVVFTTQVIEHVAEHQQLLAEAFRILKPGGAIILSGPMAWEHHEEPYDFFRFTRYGFEHILTKAGFVEITSTPNGGKWAMAGQLLHNTLRSFMYGKKTAARGIIRGIYFLFRWKILINVIFAWLDKKDKDYTATLNFVVTARKP